MGPVGKNGNVKVNDKVLAVSEKTTLLVEIRLDVPVNN